MKKYFFGLVMSLFVFTGCATVTNSVHISDQALDAAGLSGAPKWILTNGDGFYSAVGTAPIENKDVTTAVAKATDEARVELAKSFNITVEGDATVASSITQKIETVKLPNTKTTEIWITPDGTRVYVLLQMLKHIEKE